MLARAVPKLPPPSTATLICCSAMVGPAWLNGATIVAKKGPEPAADSGPAGDPCGRRGRASSLVDMRQQRVDALPGIPVEHAGVLLVEERVLDAGVAGALATLADEDHPGLPHLQHRHAGDGAGGILLGGRVDDKIGRAHV